MSERPLILLSNDDGIYARGIHALAETLSSVADLYIVAPHMERSAFSHALTISSPLRVQQIDSKPYCNQIFEVNGTPVDCVKIGLDKIMPKKPDLVVSGINRGANMGTDILYSGTVGAAMEALINGCPAIAMSCHGPFTSDLNYHAAAELARELVESRDLWFDPKNSWMLNVNAPTGYFDDLKGVKSASLGLRLYDDSYWKKTDPRGRDYYWLGADSQKHVDIDGSDCNYLDQGFATMTTLKPSMLADDGQDHLVRNLSDFNLKK